MPAAVKTMAGDGELGVIPRLCRNRKDRLRKNYVGLSRMTKTFEQSEISEPNCK